MFLKMHQTASPIYINKGDKIVCQNGHYVAEFILDIRRGDVMDAQTQISNWAIPEPKRGSSLPQYCPLCGDIWARDAHKGFPSMQVFIKGKGWL